MYEIDEMDGANVLWDIGSNERERNDRDAIILNSTQSLLSFILTLEQ